MLTGAMTPTPGRPPSERRVLIADAAIALLAERGAQGLTHRALDERLGFATGSTSYYFRTREALVSAAVDRIVALDEAELDAVFARHGGLADSAPDAGVIAELFSLWTAPERRARLAARFELMLVAARDDRPHPMLEARRHFVERTREALERLDAPDPDSLAGWVVAFFDGLLLDALVSRQEHPATRLDLLRAVEQAVLRRSDAPS